MLINAVKELDDRIAKLETGKPQAPGQQKQSSNETIIQQNLPQQSASANTLTKDAQGNIILQIG